MGVVQVEERGRGTGARGGGCLGGPGAAGAPAGAEGNATVPSSGLALGNGSARPLTPES